MKKLNTRYFFLFIIISFALQIVWENLQAPLYAGFVSFSGHFPMCFWAAIGDVIISVGVLLFVILLKQASPMKFNKNDFIALAIIGFVIAVAIEQNALLAGKWGYNSAMPLAPYFRVGLAPVSQMTLLLPLSFYLAQKLAGLKKSKQ
ncbi:hypothetical protein A3G50_03040 [Candidatus Jorgensenbacteria bacterium RIFCSPLOWO2_12_FULL_42_11]|uniref:Uncharacterized protein n=1 Tax=Candidatus Jorgensenbacteria bacterium RIFCSPLOWO2_12_FULL_42_11 TaxID=1798473 RepID=A0A1F6C444_9BACT|nr:MAG: hypothetical protein A3G50_03040 [Candidatus Jorgensenbacteria bacterium RIFCSPLOWO2_12_FULL_42_11]